MSYRTRKIINQIEKFIPDSLYHYLRHIRNLVRHIPYRWKKNQFCPVCEKYSSSFVPFGSDARKNALCLRCGSLERDRLVWLYFKRKTDLFDGKPRNMLHLAPEPAFEWRLRKCLAKNYLTADLFSKRVMVKMDITDIRYPNNYFDVIYCSHVLEHVQDDQKAIRELSRVLSPTGWAILLVPVNADLTYEDASINDPEERKRLFGQEDHVRIYGKDFVARVRKNGFDVTVVHASDFLSSEEQHSQGITEAAGEIFFCTKKNSSGCLAKLC